MPPSSTSPTSASLLPPPQRPFQNRQRPWQLQQQSNTSSSSSSSRQQRRRAAMVAAPPPPQCPSRQRSGWILWCTRWQQPRTWRMRGRVPRRCCRPLSRPLCSTQNTRCDGCLDVRLSVRATEHFLRCLPAQPLRLATSHGPNCPPGPAASHPCRALHPILSGYVGSCARRSAKTSC